MQNEKLKWLFLCEMRRRLINVIVPKAREKEEGTKHGTVPLQDVGQNCELFLQSQPTAGLSPHSFVLNNAH